MTRPPSVSKPRLLTVIASVVVVLQARPCTCARLLLAKHPLNPSAWLAAIARSHSAPALGVEVVVEEETMAVRDICHAIPA